MNMNNFNILALPVLVMLCIPALASGIIPGVDLHNGGDYAIVSEEIISGNASLPQIETRPPSLAPVQGSVQDMSIIQPPPGSADLPPPALKNTPVQGREYVDGHEIITDTRTGQKYVKDRVIVRFKSQKNAGLSLSSEKIRVAHANAGGKLKKISVQDVLRGCSWFNCPRELMCHR